mmetsp:Transcript_30114/g.89464  ORF Transcript_30114/g.89464 Transcript_30114/m.89464 type:complete len:100 (-) Transcript_30114:264-563(-)
MAKSSPQRAGGLSLLLSLALVAVLAYLWQPAEETSFVGLQLQRAARSTHVEMMGDKGKTKAGGGGKAKAAPAKAAPAKKGGKEAPAAPAKAAPAKKAKK